MIEQNDNIQMLHYITNGVIERNNLDQNRELRTLLIDAVYEIKGAMLDGIEQNDLPGFLQAVRGSGKYDLVMKYLDEVEEQLMLF